MFLRLLFLRSLIALQYLTSKHQTCFCNKLKYWRTSSSNALYRNTLENNFEILLHFDFVDFCKYLMTSY